MGGGDAVIAVSGWPHPAQKFIPGAFWRPQWVQEIGAGVADTRVFCPQLVQKALSTGTSARQFGQGRVKG